MTNDVFERLADAEVPPVPARFDKDVHARLNRVLLVTHVAELFLSAAVYGLGQFGKAFVGLIAFTFTGKVDVDRHDGPAPGR